MREGNGEDEGGEGLEVGVLGFGEAEGVNERSRAGHVRAREGTWTGSVQCWGAGPGFFLDQFMCILGPVHINLARFFNFRHFLRHFLPFLAIFSHFLETC